MGELLGIGLSHAPMFQFPDENMADILRGLANEPPEGRAMVVRLILGQAPHAMPLLRQIVSTCRDVTERRHLQQAMSAAGPLIASLDERQRASGRSALRAMGGNF